MDALWHCVLHDNISVRVLTVHLLRVPKMPWQLSIWSCWIITIICGHNRTRLADDQSAEMIRPRHRKEVSHYQQAVKSNQTSADEQFVSSLGYFDV